MAEICSNYLMFIVMFMRKKLSKMALITTKKPIKQGFFCHLVRLMGFEPISYNGIP